MKDFEEQVFSGKSGEKKFMMQFVRIMQLSHRIRHENMPFPGGYRGQGRVLTLLKMKPETTQKELAYILDIRNQSLGELLTKLEKAGFIERIPSEEDKRAMKIRLTDAGKEAAEQADEYEEKAGKIFDVLSEGEQEQLCALLDKIITGLEKQAGDDNEDFAPGMRKFGHHWHGRPHKGHFHHCKFFKEDDSAE